MLPHAASPEVAGRSWVLTIEHWLSNGWSTYEDSYRLCYVRDPEGIIIELAEQIG